MPLVCSEVIEELATTRALFLMVYVAQLFEKFDDTLTLPFRTGTIGAGTVH